MIVLDSRHATELMVGVQEASMARGNANVRFPLVGDGYLSVDGGLDNRAAVSVQSTLVRRRLLKSDTPQGQCDLHFRCASAYLRPGPEADADAETR